MSAAVMLYAAIMFAGAVQNSLHKHHMGFPAQVEIPDIDAHVSACRAASQTGAAGGESLEGATVSSEDTAG